MWKQCKFLNPCWSSMTSLHMVGVKICLCFDSQAFPQKYKKHMFWQPCEAVGRGETCTSLWWESIDGEFATMKPPASPKGLINLTLQLQGIHQNLAFEENLQSWLHLVFHFKEPWDVWILASFSFSGSNYRTVIQTPEIPVLVFSQKTFQSWYKHEKLWVYMFYECLFPAMDPRTSVNRYIIWHTDKKAGIPKLNINTILNNVWISICANDKASNSTASSLALRNIKNSRICHKNTMILLSHKAHTLPSKFITLDQHLYTTRHNKITKWSCCTHWWQTASLAWATYCF